jgi:hypothetical protein
MTSAMPMNVSPKAAQVRFNRTGDRSFRQERTGNQESSCAGSDGLVGAAKAGDVAAAKYLLDRAFDRAQLHRARE